MASRRVFPRARARSGTWRLARMQRHPVSTPMPWARSPRRRGTTGPRLARRQSPAPKTHRHSVSSPERQQTSLRRSVRERTPQPPRRMPQPSASSPAPRVPTRRPSAGARLANTNGTAIGEFARATGVSSIAVGQGALASNTNSAAFGEGVSTSRDGQYVFGHAGEVVTGGNTYTMPGISSMDSRNAQVGPLGTSACRPRFSSTLRSIRSLCSAPTGNSGPSGIL
jgi:Head domain of trimeric autotransporter adhesin